MKDVHKEIKTGAQENDSSFKNAVWFVLKELRMTNNTAGLVMYN